MGVLAEFIAASKEKALSYSGRATEIPETNIRRYRAFTSIELGTLLDLLSGQPFYTANDSEFPTERIEDGGEQVWTLISPRLVAALAAAKASELASIAKRWCESDELKLWNNYSGEMAPILSDIKTLFEFAIAEDLPVYLWNCV